MINDWMLEAVVISDWHLETVVVGSNSDGVLDNCSQWLVVEITGD